MAQTKDYDKFVVDEFIVAWFIPCDPLPAEWVAPIIIYDLPSASAIYLNDDGSLKSSPSPRYESIEAHERLDAVMADVDLMARIVSTYPPSSRCPKEFLRTTGPLDTAEIFNPVTQNFESTGTMQADRSEHTSTLLNNGKVLIAGGKQVAAELFDPTIGTFSFTGEMKTLRRNHTATLLQSGNVLIAGGIDGSDVLGSAEIYDPETGEFSPTGNLTTERWNPTATLLQDGKVLVAGGVDKNVRPLGSAELYDPDTGEFSSTGNLKDFRRNSTATLLPNGKVLIVGGDGGEAGPGMTSVELFDPGTGEFSVAESLDNRRERHTATLMPDGNVLIAGGYGGVGVIVASAELFDSRTGKFTGKFIVGDEIRIGDLSLARHRHTATALADGRVLVTGGMVRGPATPSAELYSVSTGIFSTVGELSIGRSRHSAVLLPDGRVLITGGTGN